MDPIITPIIALKVVLGHAAAAKLALIYKGLLVSAHGHGFAMLVKGAVTSAQSVGVVGALQMVAQMLIIMGSAAAGAAAAERASKALRAMADGDYKKALKRGREAMQLAGPVLRVWTPVTSGW
jgi:hypothetical protein